MPSGLFRARLNIAAALLGALFVLCATAAHANCSSPADPAGTIIYNTAYNVLQYRNGTNWVEVY
jgi:hypothetical protein